MASAASVTVEPRSGANLEFSKKKYSGWCMLAGAEAQPRKSGARTAPFS